MKSGKTLIGVAFAFFIKTEYSGKNGANTITSSLSFPAVSAFRLIVRAAAAPVVRYIKSPVVSAL